MEHDQRSKLELLRAKVQLKLRIEGEIKSSISNWIETYDYILDHDISHRLLSLAAVTEEEHAIWLEILHRDYPTYYFKAENLSQGNWAEFYKNIDISYPNTHILRYVPDIPKVCDAPSDPELGIRNAIAALGLNSQKVLFYYQNYSPILELNLDDLLNHAQHFFYLGNDNAVIIPQSLAWMIFYSMEEEWFAGYRNA
ncbi:hypothetical protein [Sphingobacterium hungaricum]|uniref:Uncharacterized protein n=1 Tax=Sphingobacterium hungaricum TaxID=2082723 RepID=A0A928YR89_9SPHI|nr:hypothetical protein [Sphingobacterium hungaricum]MBE8713865.1 hypothetical protein [Sphingobacterium hungaricum]